MYGMFSYYRPGTREDYLMGAVMWHVATPSELEEWQKTARPEFLKRWEWRLGEEMKQVQRQISSLKEEAARWRTAHYYGNSVEYCLERANRCEQYLDYLEQYLSQGNIPDTHCNHFKGLLTAREV